METKLVAPCGMNCNICMAYLREKNKCPGCRLFNKKEPVSIARCKIKNCLVVKRNKSKFCFECKEIPCDRLKHLDKRYRTKYNMSMIDNLEFIKEKGINLFLKQQEEKYKCPKCGGIICTHNKICYTCKNI